MEPGAREQRCGEGAVGKAWVPHSPQGSPFPSAAVKEACALAPGVRVNHWSLVQLWKKCTSRYPLPGPGWKWNDRIHLVWLSVVGHNGWCLQTLGEGSCDVVISTDQFGALGAPQGQEGHLRWFLYCSVRAASQAQAEKRLTRWEKWRWAGEGFVALSDREGLKAWAIQPGAQQAWGRLVTIPTYGKAFQGCACMLSHFSSVQLFATLWTVAHQAPLVHGILQARILEWVAMPFSRGLPNPGIKPVSLMSFGTGRQVLYHWCHLGNPHSGGSHIYSIGLQGEELRWTEYTRGQTLGMSQQKLSDNQGSLKQNRAARDPAVCHRRAHAEPGQGGSRGESLGFGGWDPDWTQACALAVWPQAGLSPHLNLLFMQRSSDKCEGALWTVTHRAKC